MLSRVANSIYWLSRYMERAENVARFIDVNLQMILDLPSGSTEQWAPLVIITGDDKAFAARFKGATRENVIRFLTFDTDNSNSIISCLLHTRGHFLRNVGADQHLPLNGQRRRIRPANYGFAL
jgi:uncharacterized alpha-E superfamily protein